MTIQTALAGRIPDKALAYAVQLYEEKPFGFKLSRARSSKLGDFRYDPRNGALQVTVNLNLNEYQFLITYIHEVAHRYVFDPKRRVKPHGKEWKTQFQRLMLPVLNTDVFPDDVLRVLARHMKNPKASTAADPALVQVLAKYSLEHKAGRTLKDLPTASIFEFRGKSYKKLQEKRTRAFVKR